VTLLRRDGTVLAFGGGRELADLRPPDACAGTRIDAFWPAAVVGLVTQLMRKAIALRAATEARIRQHGSDYEVRVSPQGPDRALCIIRALGGANADPVLEATDERPRPHLDRRGFLKRFKESMAMAALREKSMALAVIHVDGVADISQIISPRVSEQIMSSAILRLPAPHSPEETQSPWYLGQLSDSLLALVLETADRASIEQHVSQVCASLRVPVSVGPSQFHLTPYAGVAILGQDASAPRLLLDHARSAATEARRDASPDICFFSDTLRLESLARLDIARELQQAIVDGDIRFRYYGRHELASGRRVAWVGYLQWRHALRGAIRPAEFLRMAEVTGLATALSRAMLAQLREDFTSLRAQSDDDVRISFGALRHHVLHEDFVAEIREFLAEASVPAERLELRISEKALIARDPGDFRSLQKRGVTLVVDEVARGMGSFDRLARSPVSALQLDRAWTTALRHDEVARKVCRASVAVASALGLVPIATGVDDMEQRDALLELGCPLGMGDLYRDPALDIFERLASAASR